MTERQEVIPLDADVETTQEQYPKEVCMKVDLDRIEQNENSRAIYKATDLAELMHSMKKDGLLQPVGVRKIGKGKYEAVFGNRRIVAARKLGWADIPVHIVEADTEIDRDILNLIENMKRQNTTLAEDGRMFDLLLSRGLTVDEMAVRLDINKIRIQTAIDVFKNVPPEYRPIIMNRPTSGSGKRAVGTISASAAHTIMNLRKFHRLNRSQFRQLLNYAKTEDANTQNLNQIAPLMSGGLSFADAIKNVGRKERIALHFFMDADRIKKLEKKYDKTIHEIIWSRLEADQELKIERRIQSDKYEATASKRKEA